MAGKTWIRGVLALAAMVVFVGGCSDDDEDNPTGGNDNGGDVSAPAEWVGRWAGTTTTTPCTGLVAGGAEPDTISICEGDSVDDIPPVGFVVNCSSVTWNATIIDFDCTATGTFAGCTIDATIVGSGTRTGDQVDISWETDAHLSGQCFDQEDFCDMTTTSYTRISATPDLSECGFVGAQGRAAVEGWVREALTGGVLH